MSAPGTCLHLVERTLPSRTILFPWMAGSSNDFRSGDRGLKNGPAVCDGVMSSGAAQAGVGSIPTVAATASSRPAVRLDSASDTINDAARKPRRVSVKSSANFIDITLHGIAGEARSLGADDVGVDSTPDSWRYGRLKRSFHLWGHYVRQFSNSTAYRFYRPARMDGRGGQARRIEDRVRRVMAGGYR